MKRLVAIFIIYSITLYLQGATLQGFISDGKTGNPINGAELKLEPTGSKTITHDDGSFTLESLKQGTYTISISKTGYTMLIMELDVFKDQVLHLKMQPAIFSESITVTATRAMERSTPVVFSDVSAQTIRDEHTVEDIPMLLMGQPNVYSYSDDGSGIGYSYLKIRGFDQTRIGVMINGVPLNDPEDHQVYWVDMPDFAESIDSIQIQRGVGSSLYGVDTFGGSVNLLTTQDSTTESYEASGYAGSYNTWKAGFKGEMPLNDGSTHISFRASTLSSDGYRENSGGEQWSGYFSISHYGNRSVTRLITYTGNELTHAAWEASSESDLKENHRHNPISYANTIDNFTQPHYELHHTFLFSENVHWKNTLFAIKGKGYYEQYKYGRDMWEYGLWEQTDNAPESDIIRQKWVRKTQYGLISELGIDHGNGDLTMGGYVSIYNSHHWGELDDLIDLDLPSYTPGFIYHKYFSDKDSITLYLNELYKVSDAVTLMANLHYQQIEYSLDQQAVGNFEGENLHSLSVDYSFLNPRIGVNVNLSESMNAFINISVSNREPADSQLFDTWMGPDDLGVAPLFNTSTPEMQDGVLVRTHWRDPQVESEELIDYEFGFIQMNEQMTLKANLFWMDFRNEIVPYGQVNDDGFPVRGNAEKTVHRGLELSGSFSLTPKLNLDTNLSFNDNYYRTFLYKEFDWETGAVIEQDYSGNTISGFPDLIANTTLAYRSKSLTTSIRWQHFGQQYLDNTEDDERVIPSYNLVNAWLRYKLPWTGRFNDVELSLKANNILNKKAYSAGYYDAWAGENYYWPSAGFNIQFGVRVKNEPK